MSLEIDIGRNWKGFSLDMGFRADEGTLGILGASGCGKSMTLKCIAGVETPDRGRIAVDGRVLYDREQRIHLRPQDRRIGYLFQQYALFPHMSVEENIACALGCRRKRQRGDEARALLRRFQLEDLGSRYPGQLSGGQQQRVALARILASEPDALLLDEPFSALDHHLKEQLQMELLELLRPYRGHVVIVTHSRDEVYRLCKQLVVMDQGRCVVSGETKELFRRPGSYLVARLTGCKNFSAAVPLGQHRVLAKDWGVELVVSDKVTEDIDCVGIRAHDFHPATSLQEVNAFSVKPRERLESPFERNMMMAPEARPEETIWWKAGKEGDGAIPGHLSVKPENVLLLREGAIAEERRWRK